MSCSSCPEALNDPLAHAPRGGERQRSGMSAALGCCCGIVALVDQLVSAVLDPCPPVPAGGEEAEGSDASPCCAASGPVGIVEACLAAFAELGDPDAMASEDLVAMLRQAPGFAVGRWRFADLTQARLAHLLAPYEVTTRDITLPDGRRRKAYRLSALLAAAGTGYR